MPTKFTVACIIDCAICILCVIIMIIMIRTAPSPLLLAAGRGIVAVLLLMIPIPMIVVGVYWQTARAIVAVSV